MTDRAPPPTPLPAGLYQIKPASPSQQEGAQIVPQQSETALKLSPDSTKAVYWLFSADGKIQQKEVGQYALTASPSSDQDVLGSATGGSSWTTVVTKSQGYYLGYITIKDKSGVSLYWNLSTSNEVLLKTSVVNFKFVPASA